MGGSTGEQLTSRGEEEEKQSKECESRAPQPVFLSTYYFTLKSADDADADKFFDDQEGADDADDDDEEEREPRADRATAIVFF